MLSEVSAHPDYTEIGRDEYMDAWDGGNPLFDLQCETDEPGGCRAFVNLVEDDEFVADISGLVSGTNLSIHYRITPAEDIEASLEALEQVGFEHHRTDPPDPDETAFEQVFTAIEETSQKTAGDSCEPSRETEQTVFDGRYQCGECGTMRQIRTFAGVARPPAEIGTDCPDCDGERQFDAITPDADSVVHRWVLEFEDVLREPYRLTLKAPSRTHARRTAQAAHPDRSIELVLLRRTAVSMSFDTQTTLTAFETEAEQSPTLPARVDDPAECHQQQLLTCAQAHARSVDLEVDLDMIEWKISTNAQRTRRAGDCRYNRQTGRLTITLTWAAYAALGWEAFSETVRHELIHAHQFVQTGQSGHGQTFKRLARQVDTHVHCQRFTTGRLLLRCGEGCEDHRDKASKVVKHPEQARCRPHDASLTIEHVETGRTWTDYDGYERQRAAIERSTDVEW